MSRQTMLGAGLLLGLIVAASPSFAKEELTIETRLIKLERQVNNQTLLGLLDRIDSMQLELQEMRAISEEQTHQLELLKKRQRELYLDLDRRLSQAEREGSVVQPVAVSGATTASGSLALVGGTLSPQPPVQQSLVQQPVDSGTGSNQVGIPPEAEPPALVKEREAYQSAFNLLRQLQYDPATTAFKSFIKKYPDGSYAHIAQYWLGEVSYARRDFKQAIADYQLLIDNYPQSPKVAEAMLKQGYSRWELKAVIGAQTILDQLVSTYPDSPEAKQAQPLLNKLNRRLNN